MKLVLICNFPQNFDFKKNRLFVNNSYDTTKTVPFLPSSIYTLLNKDIYTKFIDNCQFRVKYE